MLTLRLLGGLWLENASGTSLGRGAQRRRLALLALVSLSPNRRITRDKALAILWPEATSEEGRRRLSTALYDVRHTLGEQIIQSAGDELWIGPESPLTTDVERFETAARAADWEEAVASYGGPFLDGVHLSDSGGEFDDWLSAQRDRLHRLYAQSLEYMALERRAKGSPSAAVAALLRLLELEPLSGRVARLTAEMLVHAGDRSQAIQVLEQHSSLVRHELDAEPDAGLVRYLRALRRETIASSGEHRQPLAARGSDSPLSVAAASPETAGEIGVLAVAPAAPHVVHGPFGILRRRAAAATMGLATIASIAVLASAAHAWHRDHSLPSALPSVNVLPFASDLAERALGDKLAARVTELLRLRLDESGAFSPSVSKGDGDVLSGSVSLRGDSVHVNALLREAATGASVAEADVDSPSSGVDSAATELARRLVAAALDNGGRYLESAAVRSTTSLPAVRAFLLGERDFRDGRYDAAAVSFRTAADRDTTFALAHYRVALSMLWGDHPVSELAVHESLAVRYAPRLPPDERTLIQAYVAWRRGEADLADSLYMLLATRDPRNLEAWQQLGETRFHYNPSRGRSIGDARSGFNVVAALDSENWGARWHLILLDATSMSRAELAGRVRYLLELHPDGYAATELQLFAADTAGGELSRLARSAAPAQLFDAAWRRAVFLRDWSGADLLLTQMARNGEGLGDQAIAADGAGALRLGRGQFRAAAPLLVRHRQPSNDRSGLLILVQAALAAGPPAGTLDVDTLAAAVERWRQRINGFDNELRAADVLSSYLEGLLAVHRGDSVMALRMATRLAQEVDPYSEARDPKRLAETIRAYQAFHAGQCRTALEHIDQADSPEWLGFAASSPLRALSFERFIRAECLRQLGRYQEAIAWYRTFEQYTLYDVAYLGLALRGEAAAERALGETEAAQTVESRLASIWRDADTPQQRMVRLTPVGRSHE